MAHCALKKSMPKDAIKYSQEAIKINDQNPKALYRLGMAYKMNKEYDNAKESFKRAI